MPPPTQKTTEPSAVHSPAASPVGRNAVFRGFALFAGILVVAFAKPLFQLFQLSLKSSLYSHILLIPLIVGYFVWLKRPELAGTTRTLHGDRSNEVAPLAAGSGLSMAGLMAVALGIGLIAWRFFLAARGQNLPITDSLSLTIGAFVLFLIGGGCFFLGSHRMRVIAFPVALLFFMVPFPTMVEHGIEVFFQHTSATAASALFSLTPTPVFREGLQFRLPGISIRVAEECSGIRSSLVLFITSLIAGYLFLRSPWKRAFLTFFVIPLGIIRNGFRIVTIGLLCVHVGPHMIDSPIHHRGGPIFFALSLIPFFLVLLWLRKSEHLRKGDSSRLKQHTEPKEND